MYGSLQGSVTLLRPNKIYSNPSLFPPLRPNKFIKLWSIQDIPLQATTWCGITYQSRPNERVLPPPLPTQDPMSSSIYH